MKLDEQLPQGTTVTKKWGTTPEGGDPKVDKVKVTGVIDYSGLTIQQVLDIATKPVIISYQKLERVMSTIPTQATVDASIALPQARKTRQVRILTVDEMSDEQAEKYLEELLQRQENMTEVK